MTAFGFVPWPLVRILSLYALETGWRWAQHQIFAVSVAILTNTTRTSSKWHRAAVVRKVEGIGSDPTGYIAYTDTPPIPRSGTLLAQGKINKYTAQITIRTGQIGNNDK